MDMIKLVRGILIGWFLLVNLIIIIWSILMPLSLNSTTSEKQIPVTVPPLPQAIQLDSTMSDEKVKIRVNFYTQQVEAYKKHVEAYNGQLTSYNKYLETGSKYNQVEVYKTVVKDTLMPLITTLGASLFAFAFVKTGLEVLNNYIAIKNGQTPSPLSKFF